MPPLNGIDRGINGEMLKALEELGHGAQIAIVDASYDIPRGAEVVNYQGDSSAQALRGILDIVPVDATEATFAGKTIPVALCMMPDPPQETCEALEAFKEVLENPNYPLALGATRMGDETEKGLMTRAGFYNVANNPERHTLFVRTRDEKAYACALFVVGHSQS